MGFKIEMSEKILLKLKQTLQMLTTTILSLLLPLSFLLLARLSTADYLLSLNLLPTHNPPPLLFLSFFLKTIPINPLHVLVSLLSVASLVHSLKKNSHNGFPSFSSSPQTGLGPRLYTAWIILCTLQVCVGLGIEGSIGVGIDGSGFGHERSLLCRMIFFLGLHETTVYWTRTIVKPVVDDTMFGFETKHRWMERVVMAMSFGSLWWWRLREEVESLVAVAEVKREMEMEVGVADFTGWWLYYLMVTIGMVRVVKGLISFGVIFLFREVEDGDADNSLTAEEKV